MDSISSKSCCAKCGNSLALFPFHRVHCDGQVVNWCEDCVLENRSSLEFILVPSSSKDASNKKGRPLGIANSTDFLCKTCGTSDPSKFYVKPNGHVRTKRQCDDCRRAPYRTSERPPSRKGNRCLCVDCGETDVTKFYVYPDGRINPRCRKCENARDFERRRQKLIQAQQWVEAQSEPLLYPRQQMPAIMYDEITEQDIALLMFIQEGLCKICKQPLTLKMRGYATDHDHETGHVRGILCYRCNVGIGQFRDNPTFLRNAAEYVEAHNKGCLEARGWMWQPQRKRRAK